MKFTLQTKWVQNIILFFVATCTVIVLVLERELIESFSTPTLFFFAVLLLTVLLVINVLLTSTISNRATALANSRTAELLETQKLFVELYRNSPVPYVLVDHKGRVTYPNHAASRLFGLSEKTFEGLNIFDMFEMVGDENDLETSMIFSRFSRGVFVDARDVVIKRDDGATRYGLLSIFPYGSFGSKKKGLMTIVDITKQKEIENAKSEFVSLASHQLRTPISAMKWNLELMLSPQFGSMTPEQSKHLDKISNSLQKMNLIIEDFLSVSQLELGTKPILFEKVDLAELFDDLSNEFAGKIADKNLSLIKQYDERIGIIETDRRVLRMAVSNLVSNAAKYTPESGEVRLQYVGGNETVTISVSDTGMGIPLAEQEQLFDKFFRASNVRNQVPDGTGLGLYIVKLAIEKLGGTIHMQSTEGKGTTFTIVLPYSSSGRML